jgi:hypothetical protein
MASTLMSWPVLPFRAPAAQMLVGDVEAIDVAAARARFTESTFRCHHRRGMERPARCEWVSIG